MNTNPVNRSDDEIAKELFKPIDEIIAKEDEELKKVDEIIHEAERQAKKVLEPEN